MITEDVHHVPEAAGVETIGIIEDESVETVSAVPAATKVFKKTMSRAFRLFLCALRTLVLGS